LAAGAGWLAASAPPSLAGEWARFLREAWPPGPHLAGNLLQAAGSWLLAAALIIVYDAAGLRLIRVATGGLPAGPMRLAAPLVAYAAFSTGLLGLACAGLWWPGAVLAAAVLLAAFALPTVPRAAAGWRHAAAGTWAGAPPAARAALVAFGAWWVLLLSPPELDTDCLTYHLVFPQMLLRGHAMFGTLVHSHWSIPLLHELPNAVPLIAGLDAAARILAVGLALCGGLAFLRAVVDVEATFTVETTVSAGAVLPGWVRGGIVVVALALPGSRFVLATAKNDAPAFGYLLAGAGVLVQSGAFAARAAAPGPWFVGALLLGCAVATKYLELPFAAAAAAGAWLALRHRGRARALLPLAAGLALPILPWALKSWVYLNDPLPPFGALSLPGVFGDPVYNGRNAGLFEIFVQDLRPKSRAPVEMAWLAARDGFPLLAILPFVARAGALRGGLGILWIASLVGYGATVAMIRGSLDHVERFAYPAFVLWNIAAGALLARGGVRPAAAIAAFALAAILNVRLVSPEWWPGGTWQAHKHPTAWLAGRLTTDEFRREGLFAYGAILPEIRGRVASAREKVLSVSEIHLWDVPARTLVTVFEPPFVWRALYGAGTTERVAVRFRQAGVRWIVYNARLAEWSRFTYSPYEWDTPMLRRYADFARRYLKPVAFGGRVDPGTYGSVWLYEVSRRPGVPYAPRINASRMLFLPGAERAFAYASLAALHGDYAEAVRRFASLRADIPGVASLEGMLGNALLGAGRTREAHELLRGAAEEGLVDENNLLDWAVAAGRLGLRAEADEALRRAAAVMPLMPERVAEARRAAGSREGARP